MREDVPGLARELRKEECPQRVIDAALRRIAAEAPRPSRRRYVIPVALAVMVLLCGLLVLWRPTGRNALRQAEGVTPQAHASTQIAREAEGALNLFGTVLLDAGASSETVISDRAVPPLRRAFDTAKNKIIDQTKL